MAKKDRPKEAVVHLRKTKGITPEQWISEIKGENVTLSDKLDEVVKSLDQELNCVMDTLAPVKKCTLTLRAKKPWYDEELCTLKRKLRKHERKWVKYKLQSNWTTFSALRNKHTYRLRTEENRPHIQQNNIMW